MSGVFGIVDTHRRDAVQAAIQRIAELLRLRERFVSQAWSNPDIGVGLGQVNIGIFADGSQPAFSADGLVVASLFGEVTNAQELQQSLKAGEAQLSIQNDTELILQLYETHDVKLPDLLEGAFGLAIWDGRLRRLLVANDRFGLIPHYYAHFDGKFIFAPRVVAILQDAAFPRKLNLDALAEFIRFQRLLGNKTYWEGLQLLPYGSVLIFEPDSDHLSVSHYWDFDQTPAWPVGATFDEAVEETARLLRAAIKQSISGKHHIGVYLSGGLDSRTILGFASQMCKVPPSITYGHPNSTDVIYAKRVAKRLGSHNYYFPQHHGKWLQDHVDFHLSMTEGFTSFIHAHAALTLEPARVIQWRSITGGAGNGSLCTGCQRQ
jgi:asparagine synthase (glutamine-hydrolysing)